MSKKITYLLGAGASAEAIPVVDRFIPVIDNMVLRLETYANNNKHNGLNKNIENSIDENKDFVLEIIKQFKILSHKSEEFNTIDTYAKFLFITRKNKELSELKRHLSMFYVLHQINIFEPSTIKGYNELDKRYLTFLISVMDSKKFPNDIKILSWNYDFQLQQASYIFTKEEYKFSRYKDGRPSSSNENPLFDYWPALDKKAGDVSLYHMNGIAGFIDLKDYDNYYGIIHELINNPSKMANIFFHLNDYYNDDYKPLLKFAWEKDKIFNDINSGNISLKLKQDLIDHIKETKVMVIIGYSFPFFNRNIDKQIFDFFKEDKSSKRIYYQSIDPKLKERCDNLYQQFDLDKDLIKIEPYDDVTNFFIPHDF